jgi:anti-anti-sigma factor
MSTEPFQVIRVQEARVVELSLPVSLDSVEFDSINQSLLDVIGREPQAWWILDLARLSYMGSAALGLMVNLRQQIKRGGGKLVLCGMSPRLQQIFRACCMERLFVIKATRVDALKSVGLK